jgi:hypothetical protein
MGHTRLGSIPKSKKWSVVVKIVTSNPGESSSPHSATSTSIDNIATQTLDAAQGGLDAAINDLGLRYTFFLLTQIALASREDDWQQRLQKIGIKIPDDATLFDLTSEMQTAIDDFLFSHNHSTDIGEMAQKAAGEAVSILAMPKSVSLFGSDLEQVKIAIKDLSTKKGFSVLGQKFFGLFMAQFLNFYLSRITATAINGAVIQQIGDISHFNETLRIHCEQSARVVYDFCGEWYSKTEFQKGIDLNNTSGFIAVAIKKLQAELNQQRII